MNSSSRSILPSTSKPHHPNRKAWSQRPGAFFAGMNGACSSIPDNGAAGRPFVTNDRSASAYLASSVRLKFFFRSATSAACAFPQIKSGYGGHARGGLPCRDSAKAGWVAGSAAAMVSLGSLPSAEFSVGGEFAVHEAGLAQQSSHMPHLRNEDAAARAVLAGVVGAPRLAGLGLRSRRLRPGFPALDERPLTRAPFFRPAVRHGFAPIVRLSK